MRYTQKHPQHTYTKRDVYYFSRVIPSDLQHHYSKPRIIQSLKTKSAHKAAVASRILSAQSHLQRLNKYAQSTSRPMGSFWPSTPQVPLQIDRFYRFPATRLFNC